MSKTDPNEALADAVQDWFFEVVDAPGVSGRRKLECETVMRDALYAVRPEAEDGPEQPPEWPTAPSVPEETLEEENDE
jgi:hypothetical protein